MAGAALLAAAVAVALYHDTTGHGLAFDDPIILGAPVVAEGRPLEALSASWWPEGRLWRPLTLATLALEAPGGPVLHHTLNVVAHAGVSALVVALLSALGAGVIGAGLGGLLFAVHPVHVEAVANVVGRAELLATGFYLLACLAYLREGRRWAVPLLYLLALGSKEIAVTLPAALLLLGWWRHTLRRDVGLHVLLGVVLAFYLVARTAVLGSALGEVATDALAGLDSRLQLWAEYARLLAFPAALAAQYEPGSLLSPWAGLAVVVLGGAAVSLASRGRPWRWAALAVCWVALTVLPVAHLLFAAGTLLAERTLYLPSVGVALFAGAVPLTWRRLEQVPPWAVLAAASVVIAGGVRTWMRTPVWHTTETVVSSIVRDQPWAPIGVLARARTHERWARFGAAEALYAEALRRSPWSYQLTGELGGFYLRMGRHAEARAMLERAIALNPEEPDAHIALAQLP